MSAGGRGGVTVRSDRGAVVLITGGALCVLAATLWALALPHAAVVLVFLGVPLLVGGAALMSSTRHTMTVTPTLVGAIATDAEVPSPASEFPSDPSTRHRPSSRAIRQLTTLVWDATTPLERAEILVTVSRAVAAAAAMSPTRQLVRADRDAEELELAAVLRASTTHFEAALQRERA